MMKFLKKNDREIIIEKIDINLIIDITEILNLKEEDLSLNLNIESGDSNFLNVDINWSSYLLNILDDEIQITFENELFLKKIKENYSEQLDEIKEALDSLKNAKSKSRKHKKITSFIEDYSDIINCLKPSIKFDNKKYKDEYIENLTEKITYEKFKIIQKGSNFKIIKIINMKLGNIKIKFSKELFTNQKELFEYNDFSDIKKQLINKNIAKPINKLKDIVKIKNSLPLVQEKIKHITQTNHSNLKLYEDDFLKDFKKKILLNNKILIKYFPELKDFFTSSNDYVENWQQISTELKNEKNWVCQECGYEAKNIGDKTNIHTHHIDGNKQNNSSENLIVLCAKCHSKKGGNGHNLITWKEN